MLGAGIDRIGVPHLPAPPMVLTFVGGITYFDDELGHALPWDIELLGPNAAEPLIRVNGEVTPFRSEGAELDLPISSRWVIPLPLQFHSAGVFHVAVRVGGQTIGDIPILVVAESVQ